MPWDIPSRLRKEIVKNTQNLAFNRYPEPFAESLTQDLAGHFGCAPTQIMVGPGSSSFIRLLLTYYGLQRQPIVIARPSFAYYEQFCRAFGVKYTSWELDEAFQYDISRLDYLAAGSVVFLASPNNPTGNIISTTDLSALLERHTQSIFVVDEAYAEFTHYSLLPLLEKHHNLVLLKTFSKALTAAGLRCGVLIASPALVRQFNQLQTPWQLSPFTIEAARTVINYIQETGWPEPQVKELIAERQSLYDRCRRQGTWRFVIFPSAANFLLLQGATAESHAALLKVCAAHNILVHDLSDQPRLSHCVRVTIGTFAENKIFYKAFQDTLLVV